MPDYVPIQDLTIIGSIGNNDLFPLSDGSGAYAVRGSTIKSYAATDAAAAAADAALSKTAAQNAATAAGNAQTAAEAAQSAVAEAVGDAEDAIDEAEAYRVSLGVLPDVFADVPVPGPYYSNPVWESGYITNSGGSGSNSGNARSVYLSLSEIKAISIPLDYKVKWVWYTSAAAAGYISHESNYHNTGYGIVNYASPPSTATVFRLQLAKQDGSTISASDITALNAAFVAYSTAKLQERQNALGVVVDTVYARPMTYNYNDPVFPFTKGEGVSTSTGKTTSTASAARMAMITCLDNTAYAISYSDDYRARVFYYNAFGFPTTDDNTFLSYDNIRYQTNGHKIIYVTPSSAAAVVIVLYAVDGHTLTDADVTSLSNGFRLWRIPRTLEVGALYSAAEASARFVEYMAEMCEKLGMDDTTFVNPSGMTSESVSTAADELKMALAVAGNPIACDIWSTQSRDFKIGGSHARTISVTSNIFTDWLSETTYRKLGGKGGSLEKTATTALGVARKAACVMHNISGIPVALALIGKGDYTYSHMVDCTRELCGMMATKLAGGTPSEGTNLTKMITDGGGYAAVPVPVNAESYANTYDSAQILTRDNALYHNEDEENMPASTTKVMTMLCALSVMPDLQEVIRVTSSDIKGGSGSTYYSGDRLTLIDALRIMMMESSNTLAECIGRVVGDRLLTIEAKRG